MEAGPPGGSSRSLEALRSHWKVLLEDSMVRRVCFKRITQLLCENRLKGDRSKSKETHWKADTLFLVRDVPLCGEKF